MSLLLLVVTFSGGMKRRVSVAIAVIGNPRIVFLDEPTTGTEEGREKKFNLFFVFFNFFFYFAITTNNRTGSTLQAYPLGPVIECKKRTMSHSNNP